MIMTTPATNRKQSSWLSPRWKAILAALLTIFLGGWAPDEVRDLVERIRQPEGASTSLTRHVNGAIGTSAALVLALLWLYHLRKLWTRPRTRLRQMENPPASPHLILFLSTLSPDSQQCDQGIPKEVELTGDLSKDLETLEKLKRQSPPVRWSWEMPLRALHHHASELQSVTFLCSEKSLVQLHWFVRILREIYSSELGQLDCRALLKRDSDPLTEVPTQGWNAEQCESWGWDFESFDELSRGMVRLLEHLHEEGTADREIVVDFTGGNKVTSVVAASVTFNREVTSEYVQTNPPWQVISYDLVLDSGEEKRI